MEQRDKGKPPSKRVDFICKEYHVQLAKDLVRAYGFEGYAELFRKLLEREAREPRLQSETPLAEVHQILRLLGHNQRRGGESEP
jgi:hypothetical protein